jgi:hypothetical protein
VPEQSLHSQLKEHYTRPGDAVEGRVGGYVADILRGDQLIEIQTGNFQGEFRRKIRELLRSHMVHVVYPVAERRWIIRREGDRRTRRVSPRRGRVEELFNELVYAPDLPTTPGFSLEVVLVDVEEDQEVKWRGRRRTRYRATDRRLLRVVGSRTFSRPEDYLGLLPGGLETAFTARELTRRTGIRITLARRMVYCLAKMGLLKEVGAVARAKLYQVKRG